MDYDQPFVAKASTRSILVHDQLLASVSHICIEMCQERSVQVSGRTGYIQILFAHNHNVKMLMVFLAWSLQ